MPHLQTSRGRIGKSPLPVSTMGGDCFEFRTQSGAGGYSIDDWVSQGLRGIRACGMEHSRRERRAWGKARPAVARSDDHLTPLQWMPS